MSAHDPPAEDWAALARDWATVWHSELAALATDREAQEGWQALLALWAEAAAAVLSAAPRSAADAADRRTRAAAPAGAAAAAAAPDPRDLEIDRLSRRVAELERRLAQLERKPDRA